MGGGGYPATTDMGAGNPDNLPTPVVIDTHILAP
jgi:hypothetical protein